MNDRSSVSHDQASKTAEIAVLVERCPVCRMLAVGRYFRPSLRPLSIIALGGCPLWHTTPTADLPVQRRCSDPEQGIGSLE